MATVFRKTITRKLPVKSELFLKNGATFARWTDRAGKKHTAQVFEGRDGSLRIRVEASTYTAKYRDGSGVVREVATGCRKKDSAQAILNELVERAERVRSGVVSATDDAVRDWLVTPVDDNLKDYLDNLRSKGRSASHISDSKRLIRRMLHDCGMVTLRDIKAVPINRWLASRVSEGIAPRTRNSYLQAVRSFCRWCIENSRLSEDPTARIDKLNEKVDIRRNRRSLTPNEIERLLYVARWRPIAEKGRISISKDPNERRSKRDTWQLESLSYETIDDALKRAEACLEKDSDQYLRLDLVGQERALIYKTMILTGLRRGELASLTIGSLFLDCPAPYLILEAKNAKNRQLTEIPLREDLAGDLKAWIDLRAKHNRAAVIQIEIANDISLHEPFLKVPKQLIRTLDRDLSVAGIPKTDDRGRTIDVHALRHSFGSLLSAGGVAPRTAQAAMRHSSIDLTMNVYTDPRLLDIAGALESLPAMPLGHRPDEKQQQQATGTDPSFSLVAPMVAPNSGKESKLGTITDNSKRVATFSESQNKPTNQGYNEKNKRVANGTRTHDLRNHNPAL